MVLWFHSFIGFVVLWFRGLIGFVLSMVSWFYRSRGVKRFHGFMAS